MFMYLQKNKKGFTLIELMVVVAIIGILALLGLRLYLGQQEKAKNSIVKANASTIHTLLQAELADTDAATIAVEATLNKVFADSGIQNPFTQAPQATNGDGTTVGTVQAIVEDFDEDDTDDGFYINGVDAEGNDVYDPDLEAHS
jgi:prepilin-type N-terminal cleavage/methylation domain-containing protein